MKRFTIGATNQYPLTNMQAFKTHNVEADSEEMAKADWQSKHPDLHFMFIHERAASPKSRFRVDQVVMDRGFDVLAGKQVVPPAPVRILDVSDCGSTYLVVCCDPDGNIHAGEPEYRVYDNELAPYLRVA